MSDHDPSNDTADATDASAFVTRVQSSATRRRFIQLAGGAGVAAGIAGCTSGEGEELQDSITISLGYQPNVVADFWVNLYGINPYFTAIVEPLVWVDDDMELEPWLATDWESTGDRTWEFQLREGVTFHNDEPFTAETVVFSIQEIFEEFDNAKPFLQIDGPEGVRAIDDHTVEFTTVDPFPNFPGNIAHNMAAMQHPAAEEPESKPIGTGMFQLEEREKEQSATLTYFEDYWRDAEPNVTEVDYKVIPDASSRVLSLESHEVDLAYNLPTAQVSSLEQNQDTAVHLQQRPQIVYVGTNVHKSPTDDARLRRALNYAADQELLVETVVENIGVPATGPVPEIIYWSAHEELPQYGPDTAKAEALVEESDYDGESLDMLVNPRMALGTEIAEVVQDWFDEIGVTTEIRQLEYAAHVDTWSGGEAHLRVGDNGVFNGAADILMYGLFHSEGQQNREMYEAEGTGVMNLGPELDELIEQARQSEGRDDTIRYYKEAQQLIMEEAVVVPLYYEEYIVGSFSDVSELHTPPIMQMVKWENLEHAAE
jgi:peptide/nickel transport system substrate-binding protein